MTNNWPNKNNISRLHSNILMPSVLVDGGDLDDKISITLRFSLSEPRLTLGSCYTKSNSSANVGWLGRWRHKYVDHITS